MFVNSVLWNEYYVRNGMLIFSWTLKQ